MKFAQWLEAQNQNSIFLMSHNNSGDLVFSVNGVRQNFIVDYGWAIRPIEQLSRLNPKSPLYQTKIADFFNSVRKHGTQV